jgi:hypothetical protein
LSLFIEKALADFDLVAAAVNLPELFLLLFLRRSATLAPQFVAGEIY